MNTVVNLKEVKEFIESDKFSNFLLSNTTSFGTAAFVMQAVLEKLDEAEVEIQENEKRN